MPEKHTTREDFTIKGDQIGARWHWFCTEFVMRGCFPGRYHHNKDQGLWPEGVSDRVSWR